MRVYCFNSSESLALNKFEPPTSFYREMFFEAHQNRTSSNEMHPRLAASQESNTSVCPLNLKPKWLDDRLPIQYPNEVRGNIIAIFSSPPYTRRLRGSSWQSPLVLDFGFWIPVNPIAHL